MQEPAIWAVTDDLLILKSLSRPLHPSPRYIMEARCELAYRGCERVQRGRTE